MTVKYTACIHVLEASIDKIIIMIHIFFCNGIWSESKRARERTCGRLRKKGEGLSFVTS